MNNEMYDINKIEKLRIHELRDVAREIGVKSPTSLNRPELVSQIRLILTGEQEPYFNVRKQGRPTKHEDVDVVSLITPHENDLYDNPLTRPWTFVDDNPSYVLKCNEFVYEKSNPTDRGVIGFVDIHPDGYGLLRKDGYMPSNTDTFIPQKIVAQYHLCSGMQICGVERYVAPNKPYALVSVSSYELPAWNYDTTPGKALGLPIKTYLTLDVHSGGRYFVKNEKAENIFLNAYDIASSVLKENEGVECKIVFTKCTPERLPQDIDNMEYLEVPFNKSDNDIINAVNLFIAKCKIDAQSKRIVLVLTGLSELARAYNNVLNNAANTDVVNVHTASKVNNILACAKNINNNAGITLIVVDNLKVRDNIKDMLEYEVMDNFVN